MTSQTMLRQIDRLKSELEAIKPKPPATIKVICEPDPAAGGDSLLEFLLAVRDAKGTHDHVFVVCFSALDHRKGQTIEGVRYFENGFAANSAKAFWNIKVTPELGLTFCGNIVMPGSGIPMGDSQAKTN